MSFTGRRTGGKDRLPISQPVARNRQVEEARQRTQEVYDGLVQQVSPYYFTSNDLRWMDATAPVQPVAPPAPEPPDPEPQEFRTVVLLCPDCHGRRTAEDNSGACAQCQGRGNVRGVACRSSHPYARNLQCQRVAQHDGDCDDGRYRWHLNL